MARKYALQRIFRSILRRAPNVNKSKKCMHITVVFD